MSVTVFQDCHCQLGEGTLGTEDTLYWFDILAKRFYSCELATRSVQERSFNEYFSVAAKLKNSGLLLASETGLWRLSTFTSELEKLVDLEAANPMTRSNDGRADRQGGFWMSTMGKQAQDRAGAIYRYYQGEVVQLRANISIPNAICFSPSGDCAYFADSKLAQIYRWTLDAAGWPVGEPSLWVDLSGTPIEPDGAVIDRQGFMWNAQWNGSRVVRYNPEGQIDQIIKLPVSRPTCPTFGGPDYQTLFISSAIADLSADELSQQPQAGTILAYPLSIAGLPEPEVKL